VSAQVGYCTECDGANKLLIPLHGDKGGPMWCLHCGIAWHAEHRKLAMRKAVKCSVCGTDFKGKRTDARYCSAACRQQAHRKRVTDKTSSTGALVLSRNAAVVA